MGREALRRTLHVMDPRLFDIRKQGVLRVKAVERADIEDSLPPIPVGRGLEVVLREAWRVPHGGKVRHCTMLDRAAPGRCGH
jgi:hypothetical protein